MKRLRTSLSSGETALLSAFGDRLGLAKHLILTFRLTTSTALPSRICKQRAAKEIEPFLGSKATQSILLGVASDGRNLLSEVRPVLDLFLGRRAGGRLSKRIIEASTVRSL